MATETFKLRSDLHVPRKLWHFTMVGLMVVIYHNLPRMEALQALGIATFAFVAGDILRQKSDKLNRVMINIFGPFMRKHEVNSLAGTTYLLTGFFIIAVLFPKPVVKLTLMFLAVGDPIASYVGLKFGTDKIIGKKTLQGTLAAFAACTIIAAFYYFSEGLMLERLFVVSVLSGLIGALSELVPIGKLDDNLTFPILSAIFLFGLFTLFGAIGS